MDIKDLNKSQLILLALLLSFVTSIATGIVTVTLMEQAPDSVTVPINRVIQQTIEKVVTSEEDSGVLTDEQAKLLEDLKAIRPLEVSLFLKGTDGDKVLGTGIFLGENKVVMNTKLESMKENEIYIVKSVLGEKKVKNFAVYEDFSIIELEIENNSVITDTPKEEIPADNKPEIINP